MIAKTLIPKLKPPSRIRLTYSSINEIMILMTAAVKLNRDLYILTNLIKNKQCCVILKKLNEIRVTHCCLFII